MKTLPLYLPLGFLLFAAFRAEPAETRIVVPPGSEGTQSERIGDGKSAAPYPPSPVISSLKWDDAVFRLKTRAGDNWPITWVEGDLQITAWGDGPGFDEQLPRLSLGFARVWGEPPNLRAEDFATDADTLEGGGSRAIKASGLILVDGTLYMWVRNYRPPGSDDFTNARLAWSKNHGTNWTWADWHFADTFGCPEFVQFGPNYANARDDYVYVVSQANDSAYGYSPDIVMARVPKNQVPERDSYECFAGRDPKGEPRWSSDLKQRQPVFTDPRGTQRVAITYNSGLKRYMLTTSHRPVGSQATHTPALGVFDAPEPWGPWTSVYYDSRWSGTNRTYHHKFPTKWMSPDGRTLWLLYSGLDGGLYTLCLKKATLETRQTMFYCDPINGNMQSDGSAEHPWRTIEEVIEAGLIQLCDRQGKPANPNAPVRPGDTVLLRSGWHGVLSISTGYNQQPITIAAAPGQAPQVGWVEIGGGQNWIVRGLIVSPSLAPIPLARVPHELVSLGERGGEDSADLVVEDCFVFSVLDTTNWTGKDWVEKPASGIWLGRHGKHHVARNNYVLNTRFGIQLCAPDCVAEGNVVANFSADGMRATRDGQVLQYNVIKNNFVGSRDGDDNHDDGIQVFLFNVGTGTVRDVTLRGNIIIARETDGLPLLNPLQGIGCFDGPLVHFLVEDNVVCVNHYHGISLYDAQYCTIQDNICFSRWADRARPWIMLGQKKNQAGGNTVRDNLAHSYNFKADAQVKAERNEEVTRATFHQKLSALRSLIDAKFGALHPTAKRPRLEPDSTRYQ